VGINGELAERETQAGGPHGFRWAAASSPSAPERASMTFMPAVISTSRFALVLRPERPSYQGHHLIQGEWLFDGEHGP
jgi:hypothetical protein